MHADVPDAACGYRSRRYAEALGMATRVQALAGCGGHLLVRAVGRDGLEDACGAYPVFSCTTPGALADDLAALPAGLLSVTLVADPLLSWAPSQLARVFDVVRPLGAHFVVDLRAPPQPDRHHRRALRTAARFSTEIRVEAQPGAFAAAWSGLYAVLVERVGMVGPRRFSPAIFGRMLDVPGAVVLSAWEGDALLGADWYYEDGEHVYAHLSAYSAAGYARAVSYPLMDAALRHFAARGATVLDLGGVPQTGGADASGLGRFKQGWATRSVPALLCGRVLDAAAYGRLAGAHAGAAEGYFPAYRQGEFG